MMPVASMVNPSDSAEKWGYAWEKWEGCLIRLEDPAQQPLVISQTNLGFGDYAVSNQPNAGYWNRALVLAGRQSATSFSSLYVQLVTNLAYDTLDGSMEVSPIVVSDTMSMTAVEGICFYGFSNYRVLPRNNDDFIGINVALDSTDLPQSTVGMSHPDALGCSGPTPIQPPTLSSSMPPRDQAIGSPMPWAALLSPAKFNPSPSASRPVDWLAEAICSWLSTKGCVKCSESHSPTKSNAASRVVFLECLGRLCGPGDRGM